MPLNDITTVTGGYSQSITDWMAGDDREFSGDSQLSVNPPPPGDLNLSDVYFTLKLNPNDFDYNAVIQKHITRTPTAPGYIAAGLNGAFSFILLRVFSNDYESLVDPGTGYYWDFRGITQVGGVTFTIAAGQVAFLQSVTQTNVAGMPAALPNDGQPQFRGFFAYSPMIQYSSAVYNPGDIAFNSNPSNGNGVGWQCLIGGAPGTWAAFGTLSVGINDIHFLGYAPTEPTNPVGFNIGDYYLNLLPYPGNPEGWVYTPLGWRTKGIIGDT